jgi:hypothetical protein
MSSFPNSDCFAKTYTSIEDLRRDYQRDGFVSIKELIPRGRLEKIEAELADTFSEFADDAKHPIDSAIINLDREDKALLHELHMATTKLISLRSVFALLGDVVCDLSSKVEPIYEISGGYLLGIPTDTRLVYDFHQESNYMREFKEVFNFHFPLLRNSTRENGTMSVLAGSHKIGTVSFEKKRVSQNSYTNLVPTEIEKIQSEFPEVHCILEPGDCVVFHKDLVHKSNFNASKLCRPVGTARLTQNKRGSWVSKTPDQL